MMTLFNENFTNQTRKTFNVNVKKYENYLLLEAYLPEFKKEELSISFRNNYLTIEGNKKSSEENYLLRESSSKVSRSFYIRDVDEKNVEANFSEGILSVKLIKDKESNIKIQ